MKLLTSWSVIPFLLCMATTSAAYEVGTHILLSAKAIDASILPLKVTDLGLASIDQPIDAGDTNVKTGTFVFCFPSSTRRLQSAIDLITLGSLCEDAAAGTGQSLRFLNHFYDPQHNGQGLDFLGRHIDSLTWALDPQANLSGQAYSVRRAKDYLISSLTMQKAVDRLSNLGLMFRTLGHLMHLVQDSGQPQHTRNDSHGVVHAFETYVDNMVAKNALPLVGYAPVAVPKIEDLWHTPSFRGLADYSSRGFVSAGTNFIGSLVSARPNPNYPMPDPAGARPVARQITDLDLLGPVGPTQHLHGQIYFLPTMVRDEYSGTSGINQMSSSYSLFDEDLQNYAGMDMRFSVNSFTFKEAAKLLLPRAVAYSAGFLNYFFRGSMKVATPDEGVFAIINHSAGSPAPAGCGSPCGFRKIKAKVSNTTPGESMGAGILLLVAKYHLNTCYSPDLSGEFGGTAYAGITCRSADESIALSNPIGVNGIRNDFADAAQEFTFEPPIPINATDLHLQIIFRGVLGQEQDAVAFSSADIYEPTYLIFSNDNDYVNVYNADGSFSRTDSYQPLPGRFSVHVELRFNQSAPLPIAATAQLDPGYYHRLAVLTDQEFLPYWIVERYVGGQPDTQEFALAASENQTDADEQAFNFPPYVQLRRTTPSSWAYESDEDGGAVYWMPGTMCADGSTRCVPEDKDVGAFVRRYPAFKQSAPLPMDIAF